MLPKPANPAENLNAAERNGIPGLLVNNNLGASQTTGQLPFDPRKSGKSSHGPSGLTFSQQRPRVTTSGSFDRSQGQTPLVQEFYPPPSFPNPSGSPSNEVLINRLDSVSLRVS